MKKSVSMLCFCILLSLAACKGNQDTTAGDSTGTGAAGARMPGNITSDTTHYDSTSTSPKTSVHKDSTKKGQY